ncbi:MAG: hypothetical protein AB7O55_19440 [Lautropia sp.]
MNERTPWIDRTWAAMAGGSAGGFGRCPVAAATAGATSDVGSTACSGPVSDAG